MKASDKICVAPHQIFDCDLEIQEVGHNGAEEYIRKDALLQFIDKLYNEYSQNPAYSGERDICIMIKNKIEAL